MTPTLELPDQLIQGGLVAGCGAVRPGDQLRIQGGALHGKRCTYIGPHADRRSGAWTGKFRVMVTRSHQEAVVAPRQLIRYEPQEITV